MPNINAGYGVAVVKRVPRLWGKTHCPFCKPRKPLNYDRDDCGSFVRCWGCGRREYGDDCHASGNKADGHFHGFYPEFEQFMRAFRLDQNREGDSEDND